MRTATLLLGLISIAGTIGETAQAGDAVLANKAVEILKAQCYSCHGGKSEVPGLDVLDRTALIAKREGEIPFLVPGNPAGSLLWQRLGVSKDMPPKKIDTRPTEEEIETVKKWIEAGAEFPNTNIRAHKSEQSVLKAIRDDLQNVARSERSHQRYISLHPIWNNPNVTDRDLRLYRAAVSKLLNSLSRTSRLEVPPLVDSKNVDEGTVFRVDLRKFGWSSSDWQGALKDYPYGLSWNERALQELERDIEESIGSINYDGVPYIRGDWFVAKVSRFEPYQKLLDIPDTIDALEQKLGVDVKRDFLQDRLQRAGFAGSGVSHQNRLVDRHEGTVTPYYYRSYDFARDSGRGVLFRFPLGPKFEGNLFDQFAFEYAGGEIIWSLPNGLQGYMLIDSDGKRLDGPAPIQIVRDMREISGSPEIINGLSCIGCHKHGMLDYTDAIAKTQVLSSDARVKVESLFVPNETMKESLRQDKERFMAALARVTGPFLQVAEHADKPLVEFAEPVSTVAKWYDQDMVLSDMAAELGFEKSDALAEIIRLNQKLKELGLGPLSVGSAIPRGMWETQEESPASIFQRTAVALGLGVGKNPNGE
jgi:hypothetical protein